MVLGTFVPAAQQDSTRQVHLRVMAGLAAPRSVLGDSNVHGQEGPMAVLRLTHFKTDPADTEELLVRRAALVAAVRKACPGLLHAQLVKVDDETWIDAWRWDSRASAEAALAQAPNLPEAAAAFALTRDTTAQFADVVDERGECTCSRPPALGP